jgi:uncharacterized protein YpiB (UPF0302 family)
MHRTIVMKGHLRESGTLNSFAANRVSMKYQNNRTLLYWQISKSIYIQLHFQRVMRIPIWLSLFPWILFIHLLLYFHKKY